MKIDITHDRDWSQVASIRGSRRMKKMEMGIDTGEVEVVANSSEIRE